MIPRDFTDIFNYMEIASRPCIRELACDIQTLPGCATDSVVQQQPVTAITHQHCNSNHNLPGYEWRDSTSDALPLTHKCRLGCRKKFLKGAVHDQI